MYGEINMKPEYEPIMELNKVGTAAKLRAAEARVNELWRFKSYVHQRLDEAGVPSHPGGKHSEAGCRIGDRLDLALVGYTKPVDPDLFAARELAYAALIDFANKAKAKAKYGSNRQSHYARAEATRRGDHDNGPLVQDMLRAYKAGKAAK